MKLRRALLLLIAIATVFIAGCQSTPLYKNVEGNINQTREQIQANDNKYSTPPPVEVKKGIYASHTPVTLTNEPRWMRRHVTIHGNKLPFAFYVSRVMNNVPANVSFQSSVRTQKLISMNFSGTVEDALNRLAAKTGYSYFLSNGTLNWTDMVSQTFDISFMPGSTTYLVGGQGKSNQNVSNSSAVYFGDLGNSGNEYSELEGSLSVWQDLRRTLNDLKSKQGRVIVSEATTTVTVYDHPANVAMIASYLKKLNKSLSRQVALQVRVIDVTLNKGFNYGIDWNLVYKYQGMRFGLNGNTSQPVRLQPLGGNVGTTIGNNATAGFLMRAVTGSKWQGTNLLLNALKQQGKVSVETEPTVVTLNNQVAEIGINQLKGYLESVSTTVQGVASTTTESLTPGVVKTGFSLYILPKIKGKHVYLQVSSDLSSLQDLQTIQGRPGQQNTSIIQVPTVNEKVFNLRSLVNSGDTLVIAGFKQMLNQTGNTYMFGARVAEGANKKNVETIVLITPTIVG